ncbi:hypothetical protein [Aliikangiella coralliicola]|uniref:Uncharacterized protein n=1 Tax=Aliikangiella coralliicola TaxID=2592383 RepID=A0A545UJK9_9GAMM|nr:hypothetical protein [Aliikangiella coralliicola]TQV89654.1 hypothetical protein FLL46_01865 [Aliikangiella coralliicola]
MILSSCSIAANKTDKSIFQKYAFKEGGYSVVGTHGQRHEFHAEMKEFFIENVESLKSIKRDWQLGDDKPLSACGYNYYLNILKDGVKVDEIGLNFEDGCGYAVIDGKSFSFDKSQLLKSKQLMRKVIRKEHKFESLEEARIFMNKQKTNSEIALVSPVKWAEFDGEFRVYANCKSHKHNKGKIDGCIKALKKQIREKQPKRKFAITQSGSSKDKVLLTIKGAKELIQLFDKESIVFTWKDYRPELIAYWVADAK